ncbi:tetratricopeptide repeat protein [Solihabitans fulvus]|uniref:Tetratricopeptide repeat protein n=2 Tax=Solihabitans fulvus TaxID=1892852 RepID=A0A5B2X6C8_9PSEU|nr:BTAD domain-containing putative transcriptional regulator [Solihabitans fulvus]KAA2258780.1 tetratricopeptide repeat protein [Solihabitans fulvus]
MEFRILGPVEAVGQGGAVPLRGSKQTMLLAALLVQPGRVVSVEQLADAVWGEDQPVTVGAALQTCVFRLRRALDAAEPDGGNRITNRQGGYELRADPDELDVAAFRHQVTRARVALTHRAPVDAADALRGALALWRGPALAGIDSRTLRAHAAILDEERLAAVEQHLGVRLVLGQHADLVPELTTLVDTHPTRERLHTHLMLALYRAGRQADALHAYQRARRVLAEELGIRPGQELRELHQRILQGDPELVTPPTGVAQAQPVRRNDLPGDIADFTGRAVEVRRLLDTLPDNDDGGAVAIATIDGMAGIGKTALAVHVAHKLADRYPDAQLFVDLHAHTDGHQPTDPAAALDALLRALGVPGDKIPAELDQRSALWRAELANRRVVIVLDNAASAAHVRPLLPGASGCLVLVTSRRQLAALEAAHTLSLDVLPARDAARLFARVLGDDRAEADSAKADLAVAEIVELCGYLPLAIRIAAARLRTRPTWAAAHLAERLREGQRRLAELAAGDRSVAAAFALSYQHLTPAQQHLFRMLGLQPGPDVDAYAAAALTDRPLEEAERLLEDLVDVHLIGQRSTDRYQQHDLLRWHAHTIARDTESEAARRAAVDRVLDYYLHTANLADGHLVPRGRPLTAELTHPPAYAPRLRDQADALAWCEAEHANLIAAVAYSAEIGSHRHTWQLPQNLWRFFYMRGYTLDWITTHQHGLRAARRLGDRWAEAETLRSFSVVYWHAGRFEEALDHGRQAVARYREIGDAWGEGIARTNFGVVCDYLGRYADAAEHHGAALALLRGIGNAWGEGLALTLLGSVLSQLGRLAEALAHEERALALYRRIGSEWGQSVALTYLGVVCGQLGRYEDALEHSRAAVVLSRRVGDRRGEAVMLANLGVAYGRLGRYDEALAHQQQALELNRRVGVRRDENRMLNDLGEVLSAMGRPANALPQHELALARAVEVNDRVQEARAHRAIAKLLRDSDFDAAREHARRAEAIRAELGFPCQEGTLHDVGCHEGTLQGMSR